jgi:predicted nuclease with TOPRIM domain
MAIPVDDRTITAGPRRRTMLTRTEKLWVVLLVGALGTWGCARGTADQYSSQAERLRQLEAKCAKLEEDCKTVAAACEQAKRRVAALEEDNARLNKELVRDRKERDALKEDLAARTKERDALKQEVDSRTSERDTLQGRCERLKKGLQSLLSQDDPPATPAGPHVTAFPAELGPSRY